MTGVIDAMGWRWRRAIATACNVSAGLLCFYIITFVDAYTPRLCIQVDMLLVSTFLSKAHATVNKLTCRTF